MKKIITVFTPTYNRACTLKRLYQSLKGQTLFEFEWLIVDDGSTDCTEDLIRNFKNECTSFPIRYYKKENGGKHTAINMGTGLANGYLFFIVDSDDFLIQNAIEIVLSWEQSVSSEKFFAGVSGNRGFSANEIIGGTFEGEYIDANALEREKNNILGDKAEVYYTEILRKYPFPVYDNEKFLTESIVWNRIAADGYKIRWFNTIIYISEYRDDGLTKKYIRLLSENPMGYALDIKERTKLCYYSSQAIDSEFFNFFILEKNTIGFSKSAEYLEISKAQLAKSIVFYYYRVLIRKIKGRLKRKK